MQSHAIFQGGPATFNSPPGVGEPQAQILAPQPREQAVEPAPAGCQLLPHTIAQAIFQLIDALLAVPDGAMKRRCHALQTLLVQAPTTHRDAVAGCLQELLLRGSK